jgi:hypothetical protein
MCSTARKHFFAGLLNGNTTRDVRAFATCGVVLAAFPLPLLVLDPQSPVTRPPQAALNIQGTGTIKIVGGPTQSIQANSSLNASSCGQSNCAANLPWESAQIDLSLGGPLPDLQDVSGAVRHVAVRAGKNQKIYVVDRDNMGKYNSARNNIYQEIQGVLAGGEFGMPAYFNSSAYYGAVGDQLKAFPIVAAKLASLPASQSGNTFPVSGDNPQRIG